MVNCPKCEAAMDADEEDLDPGDSLICEECGATVNVVSTSPLELTPADDDKPGDDEDDDDDLDEDYDEDDDDEDEDADDDDDA